MSKNKMSITSQKFDKCTEDQVGELQNATCGFYLKITQGSVRKADVSDFSMLLYVTAT